LRKIQKMHLPREWLNWKTNGTIRRCSSIAFQWMVMSVCFDNHKGFGQFCVPPLVTEVTISLVLKRNVHCQNVGVSRAAESVQEERIVFDEICVISYRCKFFHLLCSPFCMYTWTTLGCPCRSRFVCHSCLFPICIHRRLKKMEISLIIRFFKRLVKSTALISTNTQCYFYDPINRNPCTENPRWVTGGSRWPTMNLSVNVTHFKNVA
jgi:hypothetical protein